MSRLSQYITGMSLTRMHLKEAKLSIKSDPQRSLANTIAAFEAFIAATNCAVSIREGKKPKAARP